VCVLNVRPLQAQSSLVASYRRVGMLRALKRWATREAGNRAATTFRSGQWRDSVPERNAVILLSG